MRNEIILQGRGLGLKSEWNAVWEIRQTPILITISLLPRLRVEIAIVVTIFFRN